VLNTLKEHDFQDAFRKKKKERKRKKERKKGRSAVNGAYARKGTGSTTMVASRTEVSF
jgi:hypothetical protein